MARSSLKKAPARPAPKYVNGVVFTLAMRTGDVDVIGIPFEHRGRTWAVHSIVGRDDVLCYAVSDVLTGMHVPKSEASSIDASRAAAIVTLDNVTDESWAEAFGSAQTARVK
ncbi:MULTISPECIES: hypothetical protein [Burkholderia cepacia complex]|uniref:DUF1488 domain-containing protein n=1 Tax=Burkholderia cepacia TaxID=292 RepID=A0AAX2R9U3_BURCE|nr:MULTISPECIES: hypothetical protein [Burkholderia cepacia complex]TES95134.1 hypothetical protein E3D36_39185 [Burkholderia cepacia]TEU31067.1 hypothetical protein E3D37_45595 [Burkholderia cepacia]TEU32446.1 hypothetical protein E3D38_45350 [Burkholderia cepacia]TEU90379.1 hypothetical protein E3D40_34925 [Burkholderia cepacia]TEU99513.1 hypothetical protein E3D44_36880 [Burkholderia cepacia]